LDLFIARIEDLLAEMALIENLNSRFGNYEMFW